MKRKGGKSFEDCIEIIDAAISRQQSRWRLDSINWFDFEDVKQVIKLHIYKKWHMWDQEKPIEPWLSRVVSNQFKNLLRNYYGNYARPCLRCEHAINGDGCAITRDNKQNSTCLIYKEWEQKKKSAYDIKLAVTIENHTNEIISKEDSNSDITYAVQKLTVEMKNVLPTKKYMAFKMLFLQNMPEEQVAKYLGYKTNEKKRTAGYKQIKNLRKIFQEKAREILDNKDIL